MRRALGSRGADLVIEASGAPEAPQQCVEMVRRGGKILFLAYYRQPVTLDLSAAVRDDVTLYGTRGEGGNNVRRALSLVAQGKVRGRELVTHRFPLEQIQEGFRVLRQPFARLIKRRGHFFMKRDKHEEAKLVCDPRGGGYAHGLQDRHTDTHDAAGGG